MYKKSAMPTYITIFRLVIYSARMTSPFASLIGGSLYLERCLRLDGKDSLKRTYEQLGSDTRKWTTAEPGIVIARLGSGEYKFIVTTICDGFMEYSMYATVNGQGKLLYAGMKWDRWGNMRQLRSQDTLDDVYDGILQAIHFKNGPEHFWDKRL